ncbi:4Fe-4S binding domain-containing protein [Hathewaya proteolytica DSM 3090]|uniref:4Fe-4S binding domain-containing protein n=1 Tax=Hathewaya proteolytica DSM 3090 TaxID=1121331 RepID=A0A1M6NXM6_9CLOT|nr:4Fe-4S binding protein [Hathewaya proteolytica]SHK00384.1 4Fe-4S binding domain-containing protein [Hathewaya proteolytica DSM 3090]
MIRKIIEIDQEKCNGCGICAKACHEGAIAMVDGKAKLMRDDYCDGLGDCLPSCPTGAISFVNREALPYDEVAVKENMEKNKAKTLECGCKSSEPKILIQGKGSIVKKPCENGEGIHSMLRQWPVQIKLVSVNAPYFNNCDLLIAADCTAYAYGDFHNKFMKDKITLIGCPKLDDGDYSEKLTEILKQNDVKSVLVARMQVPCCGGIEKAVKTAISQSGKAIPFSIVTISSNGTII